MFNFYGYEKIYISRTSKYHLLRLVRHSPLKSLRYSENSFHLNFLYYNSEPIITGLNNSRILTNLIFDKNGIFNFNDFLDSINKHISENLKTIGLLSQNSIPFGNGTGFTKDKIEITLNKDYKSFSDLMHFDLHFHNENIKTNFFLRIQFTDSVNIYQKHLDDRKNIFITLNYNNLDFESFDILFFNLYLNEISKLLGYNVKKVDSSILELLRMLKF